jgi:hypothetical protein
MLSAKRNKQFLFAVIILAASAGLGFAIYHVREAVRFVRLSETEKKVIGVWEWTTMHAVGRMRIQASHRFDEWFVESKHDEEHPESRHVTHGSRSIEGAEFVYVHDPGYPFAQEHPHIPLSDFADGGMKKIR